MQKPVKRVEVVIAARTNVAQGRLEFPGREEPLRRVGFMGKR
jgi:hypothetical protein